MTTVRLDARPLDFQRLHAIGQSGARCLLTADGMARVRAGRQAFERAIASGQTIYGANTGVGAMKDRDWTADDIEQFNTGLVHAHHFGTGAPFPLPTVRQAIAIRINTALSGHSGCSPELVQAFSALLDKDVVPVVRRTGSIGCADIGLMGQVGSVLTGVGEVYYQGLRRRTADVFAEVGISPIRLKPRDALASLSVNGVAYAASAEAIREAAKVLRLLMSSALMSSATLGAARTPWRSAMTVGCDTQSEIGRWLTETSADWLWSDASHVQDPLSLRMLPQIFGVAIAEIQRIGQVILKATGRSDDNPVIVGDEVLTSGGSLPLEVAIAMQAGQLVLAHVARNAFNRCSILVNGKRRDLPVNLVPGGAVATGFGPALKLAGDLYMRVLSMTSALSPQSLVVADGIEDEAAFLPLIVERFERQVEALKRMAALEVLFAAQGNDILRAPLTGLAQILQDTARKHSDFYRSDRPLSSEVEALEDDLCAVTSAELVRTAPLTDFDTFFFL
ncbi:aromatic amino acid ammonia-lyase [Peteryoungia ipomoeae]|uniref:Aromatic amino acid lyase n=1 Tax=Peteryoungia ipomoeae TaxID=1210932 RepID=A0A4S8P0P8_9HYPH|nr:aromatic amino acid ammonia-lyase [Peteryoungia ipomoeae]THV21069.1 aromatic amino acid lyase [Peteryoungia ipomoeae]